MAKQRILRDDMLAGGARNNAYVSDAGEVYIVKNFRLLDKGLAVIDFSWQPPKKNRSSA